VQFEFGFLLGPPDGRYLTRERQDAEPGRVVVLGTLGAPERRRMRSKRPKSIDSAEQPEPVATQRATLIRAPALGSGCEAERWLESLRGDEDGRVAEIAAAASALNAVVRAWRAAATDPYARDVAADHALVARVGYGDGEQVANGRFDAAYELPRRERRHQRRAELLEPQERFARLLGAREQLLACEELVLRARSDLAAGRSREAALQTRIALEAVLAEVNLEHAGPVIGELEGDREGVAAAANAALDGAPGPDMQRVVEQAVDHMEHALRRHRDPRRAAEEPS